MKDKPLDNRSSGKPDTMLKMTVELEATCKVVYRKIEEDKNRYIFDSLWNPEVEYSDQYIIVPLKSTKCEKRRKEKGFEFANIVGSKDDKYQGHQQNWLQLLKDNGINCASCATDGKFYNPDDDEAFLGSACSVPKTEGTHMVGGHACAGKLNRKIAKVAKETVLLIPICKHHNSYHCGTKPKIGETGNGEGFYMRLGRGQDVLELEAYLNDNLDV